VAALGALTLISAQPAHAQAVANLNEVNAFLDGEATSRPGSGAIEVGQITEYAEPGVIERSYDLTGSAVVYGFYDFEPEAFGPLYLTFDVLAQGGTYPPQFGPGYADEVPGNIGRPFDGNIALDWYSGAGTPEFAVLHPVTSFAVAAATTGVGSTFSLRIDQVFDTLLGGVYAADEELSFHFSAYSAPRNTAWLFNNFRLTETDQTNLVGGSGGVPEPATWAMMLLGFFTVGGLVRRARRPAFA
jgi:hypothetical protein